MSNAANGVVFAMLPHHSRITCPSHVLCNIPFITTQHHTFAAKNERGKSNANRSKEEDEKIQINHGSKHNTTVYTHAHMHTPCSFSLWLAVSRRDGGVLLVCFLPLLLLLRIFLCSRTYLPIHPHYLHSQKQKKKKKTPVENKVAELITGSYVSFPLLSLSLFPCYIIARGGGRGLHPSWVMGRAHRGVCLVGGFSRCHRCFFFFSPRGATIHD